MTILTCPLHPLELRGIGRLGYERPLRRVRKESSKGLPKRHTRGSPSSIITMHPKIFIFTSSRSPSPRIRPTAVRMIPLVLILRIGHRNRVRCRRGHLQSRRSRKLTRSLFPLHLNRPNPHARPLRKVDQNAPAPGQQQSLRNAISEE